MAKSSEAWGAEIAAFQAEMAEKERQAKERLKELQARKRDAEARERQREKKLRDKKLILMGVVLEQMLDKHPQVRAAFQETAAATLTRPRDREIMGLPAGEESAIPPEAPKRAAKKAAASGEGEGAATASAEG